MYIIQANIAKNILQKYKFVTMKVHVLSVRDDKEMGETLGC
jgi:hypothetical protein